MEQCLNGANWRECVICVRYRNRHQLDGFADMVAKRPAAKCQSCFADPDVIARIQIVFVTVKLVWWSATPSGKELLYADLGNQPSHPNFG
jgi:hypothetical protein